MCYSFNICTNATMYQLDPYLICQSDQCFTVQTKRFFRLHRPRKFMKNNLIITTGQISLSLFPSLPEFIIERHVQRHGDIISTLSSIKNRFCEHILEKEPFDFCAIVVKTRSTIVLLDPIHLLSRTPHSTGLKKTEKLHRPRLFASWQTGFTDSLGSLQRTTSRIKFTM